MALGKLLIRSVTMANSAIHAVTYAFNISPSTYFTSVFKVWNQFTVNILFYSNFQTTVNTRLHDEASLTSQLVERSSS